MTLWDNPSIVVAMFNMYIFLEIRKGEKGSKHGVGGQPLRMIPGAPENFVMM
jgi:hypothetical protein